MNLQIIDHNPELNYNAVILTGGLHFKMEKKYILLIIARLHIVMLDDTVLPLSNLIQFW